MASRTGPADSGPGAVRTRRPWSRRSTRSVCLVTARCTRMRSPTTAISHSPCSQAWICPAVPDRTSDGTGPALRAQVDQRLRAIMLQERIAFSTVYGHGDERSRQAFLAIEHLLDRFDDGGDTPRRAIQADPAAARHAWAWHWRALLECRVRAPHLSCDLGALKTGLPRQYPNATFRGCCGWSLAPTNKAAASTGSQPVLASRRNSQATSMSARSARIPCTSSWPGARTNHAPHPLAAAGARKTRRSRTTGLKLADQAPPKTGGATGSAHPAPTAHQAAAWKPAARCGCSAR